MLTLKLNGVCVQQMTSSSFSTSFDKDSGSSDGNNTWWVINVWGISIGTITAALDRKISGSIPLASANNVQIPRAFYSYLGNVLS